MSRVILFLAIVCLLTLTGGMTMHVHFCMNKVEGISLFAGSDHQCDACGMFQQDSNGCCHQEKQFVKLFQDQYPPLFFSYSISPASAYVSPLEFILPARLGRMGKESMEKEVRPPDRSYPPSYVLHRVFRI